MVRFKIPIESTMQVLKAIMCLTCHGNLAAVNAAYDLFCHQLLNFFFQNVIYLLKLFILLHNDLLCGLVVRVLGYRSGGPSSIPGTTRLSKK
jgi:hypothetical protein